MKILSFFMKQKVVFQYLTKANKQKNHADVVIMEFMLNFFFYLNIVVFSYMV